MSTESKRTRRTLIELCPSLHGQAIESAKTAPGIADIWFTTCAVECKYLKRWPVKPQTPVNLEHPLTIEQFRWLNKRYGDQYPCWVMLQANRLEWLLFAAPDAGVLMHRAAVTRGELYQRCLMLWNNAPPMLEIQDWLRMSHRDIEDARDRKGLLDL